MIKSLSSLRFVFALLVFLVHIGEFKVAIGHAFFIVLSGFILTMVYEKRILERKIAIREFLIKRIRRIYPLHIMTMLLAIPVSLYAFKNVLHGFALLGINALLLQTFFPNINIYFSFNGVSWNAADLMLFYLCFPFLVFLFSRLNIKLFTVLMLFAAISIFIAMEIAPVKQQHYVFYISPFFRIFDFIFGMYLYKVVSRLSYRPSYGFASLLEGLIVILVGLWYWLANTYSKSLEPYIYSVFLWIPLSLLIVTFSYDSSIISKKILATRLMCTLGGLSFSFYMIHHLVIRYMQLANGSLRLDNIVLYSLCFIIALALAYISQKYFEKLFIPKNK